MCERRPRALIHAIDVNESNTLLFECGMIRSRDIVADLSDENQNNRNSLVGEGTLRGKSAL